jgi:hypothetical protein
MDANRGRTLRKLFGLLTLTAGLASATGCQTWFGGMTLPSGHYLEHQPQYFAPSPPYPLSRELAQQEATWAALPPGAPPIPVPPPVAPLPPGPPPPLP